MVNFQSAPTTLYLIANSNAFGRTFSLLEALPHIMACLCFIGEHDGFCTPSRPYSAIAHGNNPVPKQILPGGNGIGSPNVAFWVSGFELNNKIHHVAPFPFGFVVFGLAGRRSTLPARYIRRAKRDSRVMGVTVCLSASAWLLSPPPWGSFKRRSQDHDARNQTNPYPLLCQLLAWTDRRYTWRTGGLQPAPLAKLPLPAFVRRLWRGLRRNKALNDQALLDGDRVLTAYPIDPTKPCKGHGDNCLWIITKSDRSVATFLLPNEY